MTKKKLKCIAIAIIFMMILLIGLLFAWYKKNVSATDTLGTDSDVSAVTDSAISLDQNKMQNNWNEDISDEVTSFRTEEEQELEVRYASVNKEDLLQQIATAAQSLYPDTGILPSAITALALYDSLWGASDAAQINNFFGYQYEEGCGSDYKILSYSETDEATGEENEYTVAYRKYDSIIECLLDYETYLKNKYPAIVDNPDYLKVCETLEPDYYDNLIEIIEMYGLHEEYDNTSSEK